MHDFRGLLRLDADGGIGVSVSTKTLHGINYTEHTLALGTATGGTSGRPLQLNVVGKSFIYTGFICERQQVAGQKMRVAVADSVQSVVVDAVPLQFDLLPDVNVRELQKVLGA